MNYPKIIVRNKGGIGNQLFIYAFSNALSIKVNGNLCFDNKSGFKNDSYNRSNRLGNVLNLKLNETKIINKYLYFFLKNLPKLILDIFKISILIDNPRVKFDLDIEELKKKKLILIDGYFQSISYFEKIKDDIFNKSNLFYNLKLNKDYLAYKKKIISNKSISVHVRKKDYSISLQNSYYYEALSLFNSDNFLVFVFSDEINLCKGMFNSSNFIFIESKEPDEIQELYLLTLFKNQIISNSTFSYWGALLSINSDTKVVAPSDPGIGVKDGFYPNSWSLI